MIKALDLRDLVIIPALRHLSLYDQRLYSAGAVNLLLGTAAHESKGGFHLRQIKGPALGIFQIEPATHADVLLNFVKARPVLGRLLKEISAKVGSDEELVTNLLYSACMARLVYWRSPKPMPDEHDILAQARLWKGVYNTAQGKGGIDAYLEDTNNVLEAML